MKRFLTLICSLSLIATPAFLGCSNETSESEDKPDSGIVDPGTTCTPITTEAAIAANCIEGLIECGALTVDNGCEGTLTIDCGSCSGNEACNASNVCVHAGDASCVPLITRDEAIATYCGESEGKTQCGALTVADGCEGLTIDCGSCGDGMACDASGQCISQSCTPTITEEELVAQHCGNAEGLTECGPVSVNNGCANIEITCPCADGLVCNTSTNTCASTCDPLTASTGYAFYCHQPPTYWECGGKIARDDGCGGTVMVNCGTECTKTGTECNLDPNSDSYLRCIDTTCVPEEISDAEFCSNFHTECGTASGRDSCGNVKNVDCGTCQSGEICSGSIGGSGSSTYIQQTCETLPTPIELTACTPAHGDTSANGTTSVMVLGEGFTSYEFTAPEVVYSYTATATGTVTINAAPYNDTRCTDGKDGYDLVLYVLTALDSRTAFKLSNDGSYCQGESVTFTATSGHTYYVVVDGGDWDSTNYDRGPFEITIDDGNCQAATPSGGVIISALYAGGGTGESNQLCDPTNMGPTTLLGTATCEAFHQDFIELHNTGSEAVDISGWSVLVSSLKSSNNWAQRVTVEEGTSIPAGGYYLIGEKSPDNNNNELGDDKQDIPKPDTKLNKGSFMLGVDGHKILIGVKGITSDSLAGTQCPTAEQGILFVYGGESVCGSQRPSLPANKIFHSANGCDAASLTDVIVTANPVTDAHNNTTYPVTAVTPQPRNSATTANICQ